MIWLPLARVWAWTILLKPCRVVIWLGHSQGPNKFLKAIKKFATGNGSADKTEMFEALAIKNPALHHQLTQLPKARGVSDITDAFWLGTYYLENCYES